MTDQRKKFEVITALTAYTKYTLYATDAATAKATIQDDSKRPSFVATSMDNGYGDDEVVIDVREVSE